MIYEGLTTSWESTRPNRIAITFFADRQVARSGPGPEVGVKNSTIFQRTFLQMNLQPHREKFHTYEQYFMNQMRSLTLY